MLYEFTSLALTDIKFWKANLPCVHFLLHSSHPISTQVESSLSSRFSLYFNQIKRADKRRLSRTIW